MKLKEIFFNKLGVLIDEDFKFGVLLLVFVRFLGGNTGNLYRNGLLVGKMFQNASSLKPLGQLKPNCPGMIIGRSSTKFLFFYADRKSKMAATAIHRLTLDPIGKYSNVVFSETTNMIKAKLYMNVHWIVLYNLKVFCSDMKFKMAATAGPSLTLDPLGKMF